MIYITKKVNYSFEEAIEKVTANLKGEGFGIITEIDVKETLKQKIDVEFRNYKILGACNPTFAHQALVQDPMIGVLLPCNVVVQEWNTGEIEVTTFNPIKAMPISNDPKIEEMANEVECKLTEVIKKL